MVGQAEVHVEVDGNKPLTDVEILSLEIEMEIRSKVPSIQRASIIPHSSSISSKLQGRVWLIGSGFFHKNSKLTQ
jgi:divalent metal cation (Fe/Co/Zn/Cd) transporter